jgi:hypothetical protein
MTLGGKSIPVAVVRPLDRAPSVPSVLAGLARGMRLTLGVFLRPWKVVTRQYPENRQTLRFPPRYRAIRRDFTAAQRANSAKRPAPTEASA